MAAQVEEQRVETPSPKTDAFVLADALGNLPPDFFSDPANLRRLLAESGYVTPTPSAPSSPSASPVVRGRPASISSSASGSSEVKPFTGVALFSPRSTTFAIPDVEGMAYYAKERRGAIDLKGWKME